MNHLIKSVIGAVAGSMMLGACAPAVIVDANGDRTDYKPASMVAPAYNQPVAYTGGNGSVGGATTEQSAKRVPVGLRRDAGGSTASETFDILRVHASGGPWYGAFGDYSGERRLARFASPPTVRITSGASDHERAYVHHAVALLNRALPYDKHLIIGPDAPRDGELSNIPDGQIVVEYFDPAIGQFEASGAAYVAPDADGHGLGSARVQISRSTIPPQSDWQLGIYYISTLVHELMHAVGFGGHVGDGRSETPESVLNYNFSVLRDPPPGFTSCCDGPFLPPLDIAALQALYTRLDASTELGDLSMASLGVWETDGHSLVGWLETPSPVFGESIWIEFGVTQRNGVTVPWAISGGLGSGHPGTVTDNVLATNRDLAGTVTWYGDLLGFTPSLRSVRGNAEISVNLASMNGEAGFTDLRSWWVGVPPAENGADARWGDGDLHYAITVAGNYLRSTGGDAGAVNGHFVGTKHQGVVGSVERSDLTAAFGATR